MPSTTADVALARRIHAVAEGLAALLPSDVDAVAGLELGGIPLATMVSQLSGLPARLVRKALKDYGTSHLRHRPGGAAAPTTWPLTVWSSARCSR